MSVLVKICGITSPEDAKAVHGAGADWIGLNFVAGPRLIDLKTAEQIISAWPCADSTVALVRLTTSTNLVNFLKPYSQLGFKRLQLYGDVDAASIGAIGELGFESMVVSHIKDDASILVLRQTLDAYEDAQPSYLVIDAASDVVLGGSGQQANWHAIQSAQDRDLDKHWPPFILAGGLNPTNVKEAVNRLAPFGVDVSSGVEASPGRKDAAKVEAFAREAKSDQ